MILAMSKVQIVGPRRFFYDTLATLHSLGVLHIEDVAKKIPPGEMILRRMEVDEETETRKKELETLQSRVNTLVKALEPSEKIEISQGERERFYQEQWKATCEELSEEVEKVLSEVEDKTRELAEKKTKFESELATLRKYQNIMEKIKPLAGQLIALEGFGTVALLIDRKYKGVLDLIREEVGKITKNQFELVSADVDEKTTAALLVFNKTYAEAVNAFLWAEKVNQVRLPEEFAEKPFDEAYESMKTRLKELPEDIKKVREELGELSKKWYARLLAVRDVLADRCGELSVVHLAGQTDYTFVIEGWMPKKYMKKLGRTLSKEFGDKVVVTELPVSHEEMEEAPVVLENPSWAKPFEEILNLFGLPRYGTVDPTQLLAIFYPVFFGFIIGDVGYGLILVLLSLWARKKMAKVYFVRVVASMLLLAGAMAIFWGFLFGEAFGDLPARFHLLREVTIGGFRIPFERSHLLMPYLYMAVGIGVAHILLGLVLGIINALREHARGHLIEKSGFILLLIAAFFIGASSMKVLPLGGPVGFLLLLVSLFLIVRGGGFMGIIHIPSTISNIFSYARLMALGVAGVLLADVANQLAGAMGSIWVGILIAFFLHLINIVVHSFSSTIHSVRLNVIEFFGKFYESGGRRYKPFKRAGR
jgi:V/A-type H+-transporting ATPase subunit I